MTRLFTGIELPPAVKQSLRFMAGGVPGAAWRNENQLHLTLRFIGEVDGAAAADMRTALSSVSAPPFEIALKDIGFFGPAKRAHVLWAGVADNPALQHLRDKIERALVRTGLAPETRKFHAHVTLARLKNPSVRHLESFVAAHAGITLPPFKAEAFTLFRSHPGHEGAVYSVEEVYQL